MCLISLSLSCSLYGTILMYRELCYYSWILWCYSPLYSLGMNWVFLLKLSFRIESWFENTWCMSCRVYLWWQWDITCYLMYVLLTDLRVPPMNICIGVGTRFLDSLVETLGHSLKYFLLVGWFWDCVMHIVQSCPRILEVTMEYLSDIRVLVDLCLKVLF